MGEERNYIEIDIVDLLFSLLKKWWIIALSAVLGAILALIYTIFLVTPQYTANILLYVNNNAVKPDEPVGITQSDLSASKSLVDTYCMIIESHMTIDEVIKQSGVDISYNTLKDTISASAANDTEVLRVKVTNPNPATAKKLANTTAEVLIEKIPNIVEGSSVKIIDYAETPSAPSSPNKTKNVILGFLIGFVICAAVLVVINITNDTVKSEDDLVGFFNDEIPLLTVVPDANATTTSKNKYSYRYGYSYYGEDAKEGNDNA